MQAGMSDPELDTLSASMVQGPAFGTVTMTSDGSFTYTPASGFTGQDRFTYKVFDGQLYSAEATIVIDVALPPAIDGSGTVSSTSSSAAIAVRTTPRIRTARLARRVPPVMLALVRLSIGRFSGTTRRWRSPAGAYNKWTGSWLSKR